MRAVGAVPWLVAAFMGFFVATAQAQQDPVSRLDRVIHGLSYRALPGTAAGGEGAPAEATVRSPHDADVLYRIDDRVHRSDDGGATWTAVSPVLGSSRLTAVSESPVEPGLIWAGAEDGSLYRTRDGGLSWTETPIGTTGDGDETEPAGVMPGGPVRAVVPSGYRGGTAYARLGVPEGADPAPLLFRTDDYGEAWVSLSGPGNGLPEGAVVTALAEDPEGSNLLFLGTPTGVYVSFDDGGSWDLFRLDMPEAAIAELRIVEGHLLVETPDHGRFVLDEIGPLGQVMRGLLTGEPYLFEPSPVPAAGDAEAPIAFLDYLLPSFVRRVQIEVLDGEGRWITTVRGEERPPASERPQGTRAGVHRVTWDLSYAGEDGAVQKVPPGSYTVRMTVDGLVRERTLEVLGG